MFVLTSKCKQRYFFFLFLFMASMLSFTEEALAATLSFSPSPASVSVGNIISIKVVVNTSGEAINNAEAIIQFPSGLLEVVSVSKSSSVFSLWVEEPIFSNSSGTVKFNGGVANPGFNGSNGSLVSITFKAKASGTASILFTDAAVRKNDGLGTDILTSKNSGVVQIRAVKPPTPTPTPTPTPKITETTTSLPFAITSVLVPTFTEYSEDIKEKEYMVIKGLADPNIDIVINLRAILNITNQILVEETTIKSDEKGLFIYISDKASAGVYNITAYSLTKSGVKSEKTPSITINVSPKSVSILTRILNTFSLLIPILALIILLIILAIWGWYKVLHYRENMRKRLIHTKALVSKSFSILDEDVTEEIKIFKKIKALESLTSEERLFINQFKRDIEAAEKTILNEVKE